MKSISGKNWEEIKLDIRLLDKTKIDYDLTDIQAKLAISRSFSEEEIFTIKNNLNYKNPFNKTKDFLDACNLLNENIKEKKNILVIGDYDVDGCISTSLMVNFLKQIKAKVNYYIPDRIQDGYGASKDLIIRLIRLYKPQLIIFLDCGSSSHNTINFLNKSKISSIIIDHHNTFPPFPESRVFINPKKNNGYKKYDYLCTSFLTFLFIDIIIKKNFLNFSLKESQIYILLATIADVMPLREINKLLAINTLKNFNINTNYIFDNLFKILDIKKKLELDDLGFLVAPIFNSAGRLDNANQIVDLLITKSDKKKIRIIKNICLLNNRRKIIEKRCLDNLDFKNLFNQQGIIFIHKPDIPEGIIGIIASKIKDYFNKPCIVFTNSKKILKGSARSTSDFNIGEYIQKAVQKKILISGGGHNLAAGMSLSLGRLQMFKKFLDKIYFENKSFIKNVYVSKILLSSINLSFIDKIKKVGPFGNYNTNPIFLIEKVKIIKPKILNDRFISCFIKKNNRIFKTISFNHLNSKISYEILNSKNEFDIFVKIKDNIWNNKRSIDLEIIDLIQNINKT